MMCFGLEKKYPDESNVYKHPSILPSVNSDTETLKKKYTRLSTITH